MSEARPPHGRLPRVPPAQGPCRSRPASSRRPARLPDGGRGRRGPAPGPFNVWPAEYVAIVGPSGSGKSTLLNLLGVHRSTYRRRRPRPRTRRSAMRDREATSFRLRNIGFVFQRFYLMPTLTARENVELPMAEAGVPSAQRMAHARALLSYVGLEARERHRPAQLSGGEQQRVAIARALANRPAVLLADEPTGELDADTGADIVGLFPRLNADGATTVVVTHDDELAAAPPGGPHARRGGRRVIVRLALRNFLYKPWRSALLFLGFGIGVSVMIVLLSIGEALVTQASDERLVGGGDVTVLPDGIDIEVMKTGGLGGLFFSIANARFLYLQLLAAPRLARQARAVAPQIDDKLLYLTSATVASAPYGPLARSHPRPGRSARCPGSRRARGWTTAATVGGRVRRPTELENDIDHFHVPPPGIAHRSSWAEWHYFNVLSADGHRWAFISFIVAGDVPQGKWGGRVLVTLHGDGVRERRFVGEAHPSTVVFSTARADLQIGESTVRLLPDGQYAVRAHALEVGGSRRARPGSRDQANSTRVFPRRVDRVRRLCVWLYRASSPRERMGTPVRGGRCETFDGTQAYHDHNWGVWRGVTWEWGAARVGRYGILYGRVQPPDSLGASAPLFVYLVDTLGFRAVFRPERVLYDDSRVIHVGQRALRVPARMLLSDVRGSDTLRLEVTVDDAAATDMRRPSTERGSADESRGLAHPYFIQMKGDARLTGRAGDAPIDGDGTGFFETYR